MSDLIHVAHIDQWMMLTINRPEVRNALSSAVIKRIDDLCAEIEDMNHLRAVIITGGEGKAFSAGADLKERIGMSEIDTFNFVTTIQRVFQRIANLPMPTIAAINGDAFGGGLELALACDIRIVTKSAQLGLTECGLGIIPGAGGTQRLPRLIGISRAMELIFTARKLSATDAFNLGLANYVADSAADCVSMAQTLANKIAQNAPLAIRAAKEALQASQSRSLADGLVTELASYHEILDSDDRKEGLRAFQEKRPPQFRGH